MPYLIRNRAIGLGLIALILVAAGCGPQGGDSQTADSMPTLADTGGGAVAAKDSGPLLLPTLAPYPTQPPAAVVSQPLVVAQAPQQQQQALPSREESTDQQPNGFVFPNNDAPFNDTQPGAAPADAPNGIPNPAQMGMGGSLGNGDLPAGLADFLEGGSAPAGAPGASNPGASGNNFPFDGGTSDFGAASSTYEIGGEQPVSVFDCADTTCNVIGTIEAGDPVTVVEQSGEWTGIQFEGQTAYVFGTFVTEAQQQQQPGSPEFDTSVTGGFDPFNSYDPLGLDADGPLDNDSSLPFSVNDLGVNTNGEYSFPFDTGDTGSTGSDFPFASGNTFTTSVGSNATNAGNYSQTGGFNVSDTGFKIEGGNPLYDEPETSTIDFGNNNNGNNDCPPFLPNC